MGKLEEIQRQLSPGHQARETSVTELDIDGVLDAIRANGFVPDIDEESVIHFKVQDDVFCILASELPEFEIVWVLTINPEFNFESVVEAARKVSGEVMNAAQDLRTSDKFKYKLCQNIKCRN